MFNIYGLSNEEVKESRKKFGNNSISGKNKNTFFKLFIETLGDPIIKILLMALAIKTIFLFKDFDYFETIGILVAVLIASFISAISEYGSNKAFQSMQEESSKIKVKVKRNRNITEVDIDDVVVGDIIILSTGDRVCADAVIVKGNLSIDESSLNGESKEVNKKYTINIDNASDENKIFRGTTIYDGYAEAVVTKVGMETMYGKMARVLMDKEDVSPLKNRLSNLAKIISRIGYGAAFLVAVSYLISKIFITGDEVITLNIFLSYLLESMTLAVSVLVMSVPEGLPMMITLVLSTNSKKMHKDNVLVRKMVGIETAGSLNILFTDKTGTITRGKMEVVSIVDGDLKEYQKKNEFNDNYYSILSDCLIYNNEADYDINIDKIIGGNITDKALLNFVGKRKQENIRIIDKILFNSNNKYSVSIIEKDNNKLKLIKGAPSKVLRYCNEYITSDGHRKKLDKNKILNVIEDKTKNGLRAISVTISQNIYPTDSLRHSTLVGIVFLRDDVRNEAASAIELINKAGINIIMITGDSLNTAYSIAKDSGIIKNKDDVVISSNELNNMDDDMVKKILPRLKVVARALPEDKKRLVTLAKERGYITGMTGDGVNDSIALKKADVAFAMGSGTEVAKEASDIVILDDNITSISKAILYGRTIFKNIRKFIIFQLTVNIAAVGLALICPLIGIPTPITVIQMLWINMVMDTLAGLAFSFEVPKIEYMEETPKKKNESIINKYMLNEIMVSSIYTLILCLIFLKLPTIKNLFSSNETFMTGFFTLFLLLVVFNAFNARTHRLNIFSHLKENKVFIFIIVLIIIVQLIIIYSGISIFGTKPIEINQFILILFLALSIIPIDLIRKVILKKKNNNTGV